MESKTGIWAVIIYIVWFIGIVATWFLMGDDGKMNVMMYGLLIAGFFVAMTNILNDKKYNFLLTSISDNIDNTSATTVSPPIGQSFGKVKIETELDAISPEQKKATEEEEGKSKAIIEYILEKINQGIPLRDTVLALNKSGYDKDYLNAILNWMVEKKMITIETANSKPEQQQENEEQKEVTEEELDDDEYTQEEPVRNNLSPTEIKKLKDRKREIEGQLEKLGQPKKEEKIKEEEKEENEWEEDEPNNKSKKADVQQTKRQFKDNVPTKCPSCGRKFGNEYLMRRHYGMSHYKELKI